MGYKLYDTLSGIIMTFGAFVVALQQECNCPNEKYLIFLHSLFPLSLAPNQEKKGRQNFKFKYSKL